MSHWAQCREQTLASKGVEEVVLGGYLDHNKVVEIVEFVRGLKREAVDHVLQQFGHQDQAPLWPESDLT
jgi:hypothetical protein